MDYSFHWIQQNGGICREDVRSCGATVDFFASFFIHVARLCSLSRERAVGRIEGTHSGHLLVSLIVSHPLAFYRVVLLSSTCFNWRNASCFPPL